MKPETPPPPSPEKQPWRLSWILIAILVYAAAQMAYFLFFGEG